jgi:hypothetical protein
VAAHESLPSPSEWGRQGWSFAADDRAGAERRFRALVAAEGAAKAGQCGIIRAGRKSL